MDLRNVKTCLGIALSDYASNKTAVVKLEINDGRAVFEILRNHPFNSYISDRSFNKQVKEEVDFLYNAYHKWLNHIIIDVPIDLSQMLLDVSNHRGCGNNESNSTSKIYDALMPKYVLNADNLIHSWQLKKRPIDKALGGMPPVHSNLGIITKRAELALSRCFASESYPKINKRLIGYRENKIKNKLFELKEFLQSKDVGLKSGILFLTKDELDAMFCAMAGLLDSNAVVECHEKAVKSAEYLKLIKNEVPKWPKNYRLLIEWPESVKSVFIFEEEIEQTGFFVTGARKLIRPGFETKL